MKHSLIRDIMVCPAITVHEADPFSRIEEQFRSKHIRHLPVIDSAGKLVGLITQRDLYRMLSPRVTESGFYYDQESLDRFILKHVMTKDPVCLQPSDSVVKAAEIMVRNRYGCIPIVDEDRRVIGIVTETDVLRLLVERTP